MWYFRAGSLNTTSTADSTAAKKILIFKSFSESPVNHLWITCESLQNQRTRSFSVSADSQVIRYFERTWTWTRTCYLKIQLRSAFSPYLRIKSAQISEYIFVQSIYIGDKKNFVVVRLIIWSSDFLSFAFMNVVILAFVKMT